MPLGIYSPKEFKQDKVSYVPSLDINLDLSHLKKISDELIKIEDNKLNTIEDNYNSALDTKDKLLQIDARSVYGKSVLDSKKSQLGLSDETFYNLSMDDLRDPFKQRQMKSSLQGVLNDPEVKNVIKESEEIANMEQYIKKLDRSNKSMAVLAKSDLNKVLTDPTGQNSIYGMNPDDYVEINFEDLMAEELKKLPVDFTLEKTGSTGSGYDIVSKKTNFRMSQKEFTDYVVDKYKGDKRVINTLRSKTDLTKPENERMINDPVAIDKALTTAADRAFTQRNNQIIDVDLKTDILGQENRGYAHDIQMQKMRESADAKSDYRREGIQNRSATKQLNAQIKAYKEGKLPGSTTSSLANDIIASKAKDGYTLANDYDAGMLARSLDQGTKDIEEVVDEQTGNISFVINKGENNQAIVATFVRDPAAVKEGVASLLDPDAVQAVRKALSNRGVKK